MKYDDLSQVAASLVDELASALADCAVRRAAIEALANTARAKIAEADAKRRDLVSGLASGKHNGPALSAAVADKVEAESHLAAMTESLAELDAEESQTREFSNRCERLRGEEVKAELGRKAQAAAVELDAAGQVFNAAFEKWRDAKRAAHEAVIAYSIHGGNGWTGAAFPNVGAGFVASAALHPEIRRDLAAANFANNSGSVANPRLG